MQDLLHKIPVPKLRRVPRDRVLRYLLKYVVLAVFVFGMPLVVRGSSGYHCYCEDHIFNHTHHME